MNDYFVAKDFGDWMLWRRTTDPDFPEPILTMMAGNTELWTLALRGAGVEDPS
jgi:hypothetical protein